MKDSLIVFNLKNNLKNDPVDRLRGHNIVSELRRKGFNVEIFDGQRECDILVTLDYSPQTYCKLLTYQPKNIILDLQDDHFTYNSDSLSNFKKIKKSKYKNAINIIKSKGFLRLLIKVLYKALSKITLKTFLADAAEILVCSEGLYRKVPSKYSCKTVVIPDALECSEEVNNLDLNIPHKEKLDTPVVCWVGTPSNIVYLSLINKVLSKVQKEFGIVIKIITSRQIYKDEHLLEVMKEWDFSFDFTEWDAKSVDSELSKCHIGIAPLPNNISKSTNKILSYMNAGISVICSGSEDYRNLHTEYPGSFNYVMDDDEWYQCFKTLLTDDSLRVRQIIKGKKIVQNYFVSTIAKKYMEVFIRVIEKNEKN